MTAATTPIPRGLHEPYKSTGPPALRAPSRRRFIASRESACYRNDQLLPWRLPGAGARAGGKFSASAGSRARRPTAGSHGGLRMNEDEHRNAPRHRVLKTGTIEFGGGGIDCVV